jgi:RNA polymerase sigma-70 factor (ECF subfamily)
VLEELPAKDRELLRMVFYEDVDRAQICRSFRVDREYLRVLMHRAKTRFRECMQRRYAEGRAEA